MPSVRDLREQIRRLEAEVHALDAQARDALRHASSRWEEFERLHDEARRKRLRLNVLIEQLRNRPSPPDREKMLPE